MARTGRPPKATVIKILTGNPGKRPLNTSEPQPLKEPPKCPAFLSQVARDKWAEVAPELTRLGLLTIVDGDVLAAYCQAWAEFRQATELLEVEGRFIHVGGWPVDDPPDKDGQVVQRIVGGQLQPHPAVAQQRSAMKVVKEFASLFGLDPSSRSKLHVQPPVSDAGKTTVEPRKR